MLLTRSLPPQFLLPAWGTQKLYQVLRRAHKSHKAIDGSRRPKEKTNPTPVSLFHELFPEERTVKERKSETDRLPLFEWDDTQQLKPHYPPDQKLPTPGSGSAGESNTRSTKQPIRGWKEPTRSASSVVAPEGKLKDKLSAYQNKSILILHHASKTLEESDFYRVGPKGEHIEGWTNGITRVIQSRDSYTLEPLGTYYILFSSEAAARAYLAQIIRLHRLAKMNSGSLQSATLPPPSGFVREGEDLKTALQTYTLMPGHSRLSIRLVDKPFRPSMLQMLERGGTPDMVKLESKGEGMVMFSVDTGQISHFDIQQAISEDGKRRNLHWILAHNGITGFTSNQEPEIGLVNSQVGTREGYRGPSRYILSFKDRYEARRFVREWHRRPFPVQRDIDLGDETPPLVNAEIMW